MIDVFFSAEYGKLNETIENGTCEIYNYQDKYGLVRHTFIKRKIEIPLNVKVAFEIVARTPADKQILCAALAQWPSGRTRLALGGCGPAPTLAMDGNEPGGIQDAARNVCSEAGDELASPEYRLEIAGILAKRCQETAQ